MHKAIQIVLSMPLLSSSVTSSSEPGTLPAQLLSYWASGELPEGKSLSFVPGQRTEVPESDLSW